MKSSLNHRHYRNQFWMPGFLCLLLLLVCVVSPSADAKTTKPLKVLAPDLIVESFEGGTFAAHHSPRDPGAKIIFIPTNTSRGASYGYRIKLKTTRKEIDVKEAFPVSPERSSGRMEKPINGCIYKIWDDEAVTVPEYSLKVWLDDVELPPLHVIHK